MVRSEGGFTSLRLRGLGSSPALRTGGGGGGEA